MIDHSGLASESYSACQHSDDSTAISAEKIRFSQKTVNGVASLVNSMVRIGWSGDPIDVVRFEDGSLVAFDNTRLLAASIVGIDVFARVHDSDCALPVGRMKAKDNPKNWGEAITNRIAQNGGEWARRYPNGSWHTIPGRATHDVVRGSGADATGQPRAGAREFY